MVGSKHQVLRIVKLALVWGARVKGGRGATGSTAKVCRLDVVPEDRI